MNANNEMGAISDLSIADIDAVNGGGLFQWISEVTAGWVITIFGIEVSDGIPN